MTKVDWQLYSENNLIINNQNVEAEFNQNNIVYNDEFGKHIIDRKNKIYERIDNEDYMIINFNKNTITFKFNGETLEYDITSEYKEGENKISLIYSLGEEEKRIVIKKRDEIK